MSLAATRADGLEVMADELVGQWARALIRGPRRGRHPSRGRAERAGGARGRPLWDASTARLWWVDITAERVHCFDPKSSEDSSWSTNGQPGGVVLGATGDPVVASPEGLAVLDRATGALELRRSDRGGPTREPRQRHQGRRQGTGLGRNNGLRQAAAERGALPGRGRPGDPRGRRADDLQRPAFDEPRGRLYLADTALCIVDVFDLDSATGALSARRRFLDLSESSSGPTA